MRLQFKGAYTFEELREAFESVVLNLSENNIDTLINLNFYFTPVSSGASIVLTDSAGKEIDHLVINPDMRQPFKPATNDLYINRLSKYPEKQTTDGEN